MEREAEMEMEPEMEAEIAHEQPDEEPAAAVSRVGLITNRIDIMMKPTNNPRLVLSSVLFPKWKCIHIQRIQDIQTH